LRPREQVRRQHRDDGQHGDRRGRRPDAPPDAKRGHAKSAGDEGGVDHQRTAHAPGQAEQYLGAPLRIEGIPQHRRPRQVDGVCRVGAIGDRASRREREPEVIYR